MKTKSICFRLRKIDTDLAEATNGIDSEQLSELCRNGLRLMLGIKTAPSTQIVERSISIPQQQTQHVKATIGTPQPYRPKS